MAKLLLNIDVKNIALNENAYFFHTKQPLTRQMILQAFQESRTDKGAKRAFMEVVQMPFTDGNKQVARYSLDIFSFYQRPSFLKRDVDGILEMKYGLLLIVEYGDYVALVRKNVSGLRSMFANLESIDYNVLARFLIEQNTKFEKILASNINTAENAMQRKVSEANDLKGLLSAFTISKQILNAIRLDNNGKKHSVALNTSRVNSFNLKTDFDKVIFWMIEVLKRIKKAYTTLPESSFITGFATPLKFDVAIKSLTPTHLLIKFGALKDEIEDGKILRCFEIDNGVEKDVDLLKELNASAKLLELVKVDDKNFSSSSTRIKINDSSISVSDPRFKELRLEYTDEIITLNNYINRGNHFMVNFDRIDHVYANRQIFRDSKLLGNLDSFFDVFVPYKELSTTTSEKGDGYKAGDLAFKNGSIFKFIEDTLENKSDILICEDLGTEWGDFISISTDQITFYHAKYKTPSLSASDLQDVFGQASKNLNFVTLTDELIESRRSKWSKNYSLDGVNTKIARIRRCPAAPNKVDKIKEFAGNISLNPNLRRRVHVVINSISKKKLRKAITALKDGKTFANKDVTLQILWFVNSMLCSANERNTEFRIICQE